MNNKFTIEVALRESFYWLFFSVAMALANLWLVPFAYYLTNKPSIKLVELIGNGSLLFYATTITARTAGDYFRRVRGHEGHRQWAKWVCICVSFFIILIAAFCYGLVTASHLGVLAPDLTISPERMTTLSSRLAICGMMFSLGGALYISAFGD